VANPSIRVVLADDHQLVRAGIHALLVRMSDVEVVAETGDGYEALEIIKRLEPNVVLMDIGLPGLNGLDVTARVTKDFPAVSVLILSMHSSEQYVCEGLRSGAKGYLLKDSAASELETAVRMIAKGETYLSPKISRHVADYIRRLSPDDSVQTRILTSRQREILQAIAEGRSTKEIAHLLNVSIKTVESHRTQLMERLRIHDVAGLVRYAIRSGFVPPEH
jgi:DNA-binding NarL/FixJ family response regulator